MNTDELKDKLKQANDVAQVTEIMKESGQEVSAEDAEHILQEIQHHIQDAELSVDELEAVSGDKDYDRDRLKDGCAATVEYGSYCWSNDMCDIWSVFYFNKPFKKKCRGCGQEDYLVMTRLVPTAAFADSRTTEMRLYCRNCKNVFPDFGGWNGQWLQGSIQLILYNTHNFTADIMIVCACN